MKLKVVEVDRRNVGVCFQPLIESVKSCDFVALDLELSGLGDTQGLKASSVDERYKVLCETATTHSIISIGLSCFSLDSSSVKEEEKKSLDSSPLSWSSKTFNVLLLSQMPYVVDPGALQFLVRHEFDFNKQYAVGVPYTPSHHMKEEEQFADFRKSLSLRDLLVTIHKHRVPVVVHNGLVDFVFLYTSFYTCLPQTLAVFLADLSELFSGGVYDTKFIAEYEKREDASFLEYLFTKCHRAVAVIGDAESQSMSVECSVPEGAPDVEEVVWGRPTVLRGAIDETSICETFAHHGFCRDRNSCTLSHDIHMVVELEERGRLLKLERRRKRHKQSKSLKEEPLAKKPSQAHTSVTLSEIFKDDLRSVKMKLSELPQQGKPEPVDTEGCGVQSLQPTALSTTSTETRSIGCQAPLPVPQPTREGSSYRTHRAGVDAFMTGLSLIHI